MSARVERRPGFTYPARLPGSLLRWDGEPEPSLAPDIEGFPLPGPPVRFELTPRGVITLARIRFRREAATLCKVRRDPPGLIPVGRVEDDGGPE